VTGGGNAIATTGSTIAANTGNYNIASAFATIVGTNEAFTLQTGTTSVNVSLAAGNQAATIQSLNTQLAGTGVSAVSASNGTGIELQGANAFSINETALAGTSGGVFTALGSQTVTAPTAASSGTGNAEAAIASIQTAVLNLGLVQGRVGTGENVLADAINLATSQITNQSAAESTIRDANIAQEAANLTKSQVLQQSSIAALAQANSAPEALLKLFQ
jgi:flagellin